jgi:hypothetical protein
MSCTCCTAPPCPTPVIECDSVSATGSKIPPPTPCGWSHAGKKWLVQTTTWSLTQSGEFDFTFACGPEGNSWSASYYAQDIGTYDAGTCALTWTYTGSQSRTFTCGTNSGTCTATRNADGSWAVEGGSYGCADSGAPTVVYSSENPPEPEEETNALIARVTGDLGSFPGTWAGSCSAFRNLSPDESSFTARKFRWRLRHAPSATCYLKVWMNRVFSPEGGGDPIVTPLSPYTWSGSGNPCLPATDKPIDHEDNQITGSATTEDVPGTDGTTSIEIVKWSCLPGYTPPDDGSANGYPVEEEA